MDLDTDQAMEPPEEVLFSEHKRPTAADEASTESNSRPTAEQDESYATKRPIAETEPGAPPSSEIRPLYKKQKQAHDRNHSLQHYLKVYNTVVQEHSKPVSREFPKIQIGSVYWSATEREAFFHALDRYGRDDTRRISQFIRTKSLIEVQQYLSLLVDVVNESLYYRNAEAKVHREEIPAAFEIPHVLEAALGDAADDLTARQERREARALKELYGDLWLLDLRTFLAFRAGRLQIQEHISSTEPILPDATAALDLFKLKMFLTLSATVFMNSADAEWDYRTCAGTPATENAGHPKEPSIRLPAVVDFYRLVKTFLERLLLTTFHCARSRIRSGTWEGKRSHKSEVHKLDVAAAMQILRLTAPHLKDSLGRWKPDSYWIGALTRFNLQPLKHDPASDEEHPVSFDQAVRILCDRPKNAPPRKKRSDPPAHDHEETVNPEASPITPALGGQETRPDVPSIVKGRAESRAESISSGSNSFEEEDGENDEDDEEGEEDVENLTEDDRGEISEDAENGIEESAEDDAEDNAEENMEVCGEEDAGEAAGDDGHNDVEADVEEELMDSDAEVGANDGLNSDAAASGTEGNDIESYDGDDLDEDYDNENDPERKEDENETQVLEELDQKASEAQAAWLRKVCFGATWDPACGGEDPIYVRELRVVREDDVPSDWRESLEYQSQWERYVKPVNWHGPNTDISQDAEQPDEPATDEMGEDTEELLGEEDDEAREVEIENSRAGETAASRATSVATSRTTSTGESDSHDDDEDDDGNDDDDDGDDDAEVDQTETAPEEDDPSKARGSVPNEDSDIPMEDVNDAASSATTSSGPSSSAGTSHQS